MNLLDLINFLVVLILSTAVHEMAHAWLADRFGDDTPRRHGRLTVNPFPHLDPFMSVLVPAFLYWSSDGNAFMAAAWTPINPFRMRRPRLHGMLTALGGPAVNLVLGVLATLGFAAFLAMSSEEGLARGSFPAIVDWLARGGRAREPGMWLCYLFLQINVFLAVFNALPVPPLDGGNLVQGLLPNRYQSAFWEFKRYSFILLLVLWFTGVLDRTIFLWMRLAEEAAGGAAMRLGRMLLG